MSESMDMDVEGNSSSGNLQGQSSSASTVIEVPASANVNASSKQNTRLKSAGSDHSEFDSGDDKDYFEIWSSASSSQESSDEDADKMDVDGETAAKRKKKDDLGGPWVDVEESINNQELQDIIAEYPSEDSGGSWTSSENFLIKDKFTPLYCFRLFVNDAVISLLVNETNKYAKSKFTKPNYHKDFLTGWMDVTPTEMLELIGLLIFMKIIKLSSVKQYWSSERDMANPIAGYIMTETRFKRLMSFWRFGEDSTRDFPKIASLLNLLNRNFAHIKSPAPVMYVGKTTIYLREHYAKQKKGEGVVRGHKWLRLVDNHLYTYKVSLIPPASNIDRPAQTMRTFMNFLEPYLDRSRIFIFDNLLITLEIAESLQSRNSYVVGPIRQKCKGAPEKFNRLKYQDYEIKGLKNKEGLGVYKWKINDVKSCVLSTCLGQRGSKPGADKKPEGKVSLSTTDLLKYYESRIELLELVEQYSVPDSPINTETTWYRRLACDLLTGVCVSNAYLFYKRFSNDKKCPYYKFQDHLWKELVGFTWLFEGETSATTEEG